MEAKSRPINVGCHVELNFVQRDGSRERLSVDIVPDKSADFVHGFLGQSTPLAKELLGEKEGAVIPYFKDEILAIEILSVSDSTQTPPEDAQAKRNEQMEKTKHEVEHTSAVVFASSFSGKWGDYDPNSLPKEESRTRDADQKEEKEKKDKPE